jgi:general secretion pathway protein G
MRRWWPLFALLVIAAVGVTIVRSNARARREQANAERVAALKSDLGAMRAAIKDFHKDNGRYPYSLYELVPKYIRRVPADPMTGATDWRLVTEERVEASSDFTTGGGAKPKAVIIDVRSSASGYSEY